MPPPKDKRGECTDRKHEPQPSLHLVCTLRPLVSYPTRFSSERLILRDACILFTEGRAARRTATAGHVGMPPEETRGLISMAGTHSMYVPTIDTFTGLTELLFSCRSPCLERRRGSEATTTSLGMGVYSANEDESRYVRSPAGRTALPFWNAAVWVWLKCDVVIPSTWARFQLAGIYATARF